MADRFTIPLQPLDPLAGGLAGNRALAERAVREAGAVDRVAFTVRISATNFGRDRRDPSANRFRDA